MSYIGFLINVYLKDQADFKAWSNYSTVKTESKITITELLGKKKSANELRFFCLIFIILTLM